VQTGSVLTVFCDTFQARHLLNIKEYDRDDCQELIVTSGSHRLSTWKIVYACERLA